MTEQDIAAQLDASMARVHVAFARVKQAVDEDDPLSALLGMSDTILSVAKFADAAAKAVDLVSKERDAARAEVAKLRAWLPKWRKNLRLDDEWTLRPRQIIAVTRGYDGLWYWVGMIDGDVPARTRLVAMRAAEKWAGLPECEVIE